MATTYRTKIDGKMEEISWNEAIIFMRQHFPTLDDRMAQLMLAKYVAISDTDFQLEIARDR